MGNRQRPGKLGLAIYALVFVAIIVGMAFLLMEPGQRVGFVFFVFALVGLGFANTLIPAFKSSFAKIITVYFQFSVWILISLVPLALVRAGTEMLLASASSLLQVLILTTWGLLLLSASFIVMYGGTRDKLFNRMQSIGMPGPMVYSLNLLLISVQFFAVSTYLWYQSGSVALVPGSAQVVSPDSVGDFFIWHFVNAIPILKITDTLMWKEPLTYSQSAVGWILLTFKISVIMPVIAAFHWSWARFKGAASDA